MLFVSFFTDSHGTTRKRTRLNGVTKDENKRKYHFYVPVDPIDK
jgi:hypothetical protein